MDDEEYSEQGDEIARQMRLERMRQARLGADEEMADGGDQDMLEGVIDYEDVKG